MTTVAQAAVARFAQLLGLPTAATAAVAAEADLRAARAEDENDDERKKRDDESDEEYAARMAKLDAEPDGDGDDNETPGADAPDDREKCEAQARTAERARCAAIMAYGIQTGCVRQAGVLAFDTDMTAEQAKATLDASLADRPSGGSSRLAQRMQALQVPNPGPATPAPAADDPQAHAKAMADQIIRAGMKRRGEA